MKYIVYREGRRLGTVYALSLHMAEEKAFKMFGLDVDVEEAQMSWSSEAKVYLSNKAIFMLPDVCKNDLAKWDGPIDTDDGKIYTSEHMGWNTSSDVVMEWEKFFSQLSAEGLAKEYDFAHLDNDYDFSQVRTYTMFCIEKVIRINE